jgi:N-acyl-D-amino-acid deacylase
MQTPARTTLLAFVLLAASTGAHAQIGTPAPDYDYDLIIRNGRVMDGSGNPWFAADIGIRGDRLVRIGRLEEATAGRVIDANGRYVVPGFIDIHSHADDNVGSISRYLRSDDVQRRTAPNLVAQGITTAVVNQDGRSPWPIRQQRERLERLGIGINAMLMVGHSEVRHRVLGEDYRRPATPDEALRMRALVRQAIAEGAVGISAGLEYIPGRWGSTDEIVAIVHELESVGGVYIAHQRSEGSDPLWYWPSRDSAAPPTLLDGIRETIEIGERTGATVVASHIKAKGAHYWGSGAAAIELIEAARARGVRIYADQYPYETSGTDGNTVLVPDWATGTGSGTIDYAERLQSVLRDSTQNEALRRDVAHEIGRRGGADRVLILEHPDSSWAGRTLAWYAAQHGVDAVDAAIHLQLAGDRGRRGGARMRGFSMSAVDVDLYAQQPWVATASDGGIALPQDGPGTHARLYGTFPRRIRDFAIDRGVITLEDAIRSSTSLPAQIMGLKDRGMLREGYMADIVIFDAARIRDRATFEDPHQYPAGIDFVLVNGQLVFDDGRLTGQLPGRVLTRQE